MESERGDRGVPGEGTVIEIVERDGDQFAKVLVDGGRVVEVPAAGMDINLGDRVLLDVAFNLREVRGRPVLTPGGAPFAAASRARAASSAGAGRATVGDYQHVLRMAGLFLAAIVVFFLGRSWMVPADFGVYGHFRAGAIADAASRTQHYAGRATCVVCHDQVRQIQLTGRHAQIACEACHGPLGRHARAETDVAPIRPSSRGICLTCHTATQGMPKAFPRIIVNEHSEAGPCTDCHKSHAPGLS